MAYQRCSVLCRLSPWLQAHLGWVADDRHTQHVPRREDVESVQGLQFRLHLLCPQLQGTGQVAVEELQAVL
jgi:hypothetical protein